LSMSIFGAKGINHHHPRGSKCAGVAGFSQRQYDRANRLITGLVRQRAVDGDAIGRQQRAIYRP
jgi:hypothetical protein